MEMPNTWPPALTQQLLEDKYTLAGRTSVANYSFYMGTSNDNIEEVLRTDPKHVCGIKVFMGSSTGDLLVDDQRTLSRLFAEAPCLIAAHCEDEQTIAENLVVASATYGQAIPPSAHATIRSREACLKSSSYAASLAQKNGARLHILHISTRDELPLFQNDAPREKKRITAEACVHHMTFTDKDYIDLGNRIKCNPAIKTEEDRRAIVAAVRDGTIDIIATDHAPHTAEEKTEGYLKAPSGLPLVQHSLNLLLNLHHSGELPIEVAVDRACHAPADCFAIIDRGYLDEGYWADLGVVDPEQEWIVTPESLLYHCAWSPLVGRTMHGMVLQTYVNGDRVYENGAILLVRNSMRLGFDR